jgi:3-dehydroquinate synthase
MEITCHDSGTNTYPVFIGSGLLSQIKDTIPQTYATFRPFLITDKNLSDHGYVTQLNIDPSSTYIIDPPGETSKNIETVKKILNTLDEHGFGKDTIILALGGGTVGDIAGFTASTFKRGVPILQIPTTTVAQADSAIGGKTGVNSDWSKNAIGTFWNPCAILIDVQTLKTLDERHYIAGLAESLKHSLIADASYVDYIVSNIDAIKRREPNELIELAKRNCEIKGAVVERDPYERTGLRFVLNFGHTIGHAIETASDFRVLHGEGVAIGMLGALRLGTMLNITPNRLVDRVESLINNIGLPTHLPPDMDPDSLINIMTRDKKAEAGQVRFVFLSDIGDIYAPQNKFAHIVDVSLLRRACQALRK